MHVSIARNQMQVIWHTIVYWKRSARETEAVTEWRRAQWVYTIDEKKEEVEKREKDLAAGPMAVLEVPVPQNTRDTAVDIVGAAIVDTDAANMTEVMVQEGGIPFLSHKGIGN